MQFLSVVNQEKPKNVDKTSKLIYPAENDLNNDTPIIIKTTAGVADLTYNQDTTAEPSSTKESVTKTKKPSKKKIGGTTHNCFHHLSTKKKE